MPLRFLLSIPKLGLQYLAFDRAVPCIACLHDQTKSGFFGGQTFSSQSELFEFFLNCSDWLDKSWPSIAKNPLLF